MRNNNISAYCIQETRILGDFEETIDGYLMLYHNAATKENDSRTTKGVAIILSPQFAEAYNRAGAPTPIKSPATGAMAGRFIGVPLIFSNLDDWGKKSKETPKFSFPQHTIQF